MKMLEVYKSIIVGYICGDVATPPPYDVNCLLATSPHIYELAL